MDYTCIWLLVYYITYSYHGQQVNDGYRWGTLETEFLLNDLPTREHQYHMYLSHDSNIDIVIHLNIQY